MYLKNIYLEIELQCEGIDELLSTNFLSSQLTVHAGMIFFLHILWFPREESDIVNGKPLHST